MSATRKFIPAFLSWLDDANEAQSLYFDLCMSYGAEHSSEITTYPVEQGVNVADHVRVKPLQIKLDAFVSNTPIEDLPDGSRHKTYGSIDLTYPSPEIAAVSPKTANTYQFAGPNSDYINATYTTLWFLHDSHQLLSVTTPIKEYTNLVITGLKFVRDDQASGDAGRFQIELEQLTIVSSQVVDTAIIPQAKPTENVGQTDEQSVDDQDTPRQSVLSWLAGQLP